MVILASPVPATLETSEYTIPASFPPVSILTDKIAVAPAHFVVNATFATSSVAATGAAKTLFTASTILSWTSAAESPTATLNWYDAPSMLSLPLMTTLWVAFSVTWVATAIPKV